MRAYVASLAFLVLAPFARADGPETHTGRIRMEHVEVRFRPGSRAAAAAPLDAVRAENDVLRICEQLHVEPEGGFVLYLYDDAEALRALTGTTGNAGYSAGNVSHVPFGDDQTRRHELTHLVGARLPRTGTEERNRFFADALANALLEHVHGVHVHAVAAFYRRRGTLPDLAEMVTGDFYAWLAAHPGFNAYDVGGSFLRFLVNEHGIERLKRYVTGTPIRKAIGADLAAVQRRWHAFLDAYDLPAEVETLLRQRAGEAVGFESYAEALWRRRIGAEDEWTSLVDRELKPDGVATWTREGETIRVVNDTSAWSACELGTETYGSCVIRVRILTPSPCPVQVRLGAENQAMLVNGTFLYRGDEPVAASEVAVMGPTRRETDFVLVRLGSVIEVWIDGARALVTTAAGGPSPVGIGIHRGRATFEEARVRRLP